MSRILETSVDRFAEPAVRGFAWVFGHLQVHPSGELRHVADRTLLVAHGGVPIRWNSQGYSASLRLALHHRQRTLHHVPLRFLG